MSCVFRYLQTKAFEELPEEDMKALEEEFDKLRPAAYQAALEGEVSITFLFFMT